MSKHMIHPEGELARPLDPNAERAHEVAPSTQPASEVALPPVVPVDLNKQLTLDLVAEAPAEPVTLELDPEQVRLLLLAILLSILRFQALRPLAQFVGEVDELANGRLPKEVLAVVRSLVRAALVGCPQLPADRRDHAAGLLAASPGNIGGDGAIRLTGCAVTADGYDVAIVAADGKAYAVAITLPSHLLNAVTDAVLLTAARVVKAPSRHEAQGIVRRVAAGQLETELSDAIAFAIFAALTAAPELTQRQKDAFLGLASVEKLIERVAAA